MAIAPNGTLTVDKLIQAPASAGVQSTRIYYSNNVTAGTAYTMSVYAKAGGSTKFSMIGSSSGWVGKAFEVKYDLSAGTITSQSLTDSASITSVGNGWYRCTVTATPIATGSGTVPIDVLDSSGSAGFVGDGFSGIFLWGAQLEAGSFPTSYIPTTSAAATRAADVASMSGANFTSWFNAGQGTFYGEANLSGGGRYFHTVKTGSNAQIEGVQRTAYFEAFVYATDVQAQINITAASFINRRVALAYQVNDIAACVSGGAVSVDTNAILPLDLNAFYVNSYGTSGPLGSGTVKKVAYYPQRLTNTQLQSLTV